MRWLLLVMLLLTLAWPVAAQEDPAPNDEATTVADEVLAEEPAGDETSITGAAITPEGAATGEPTSTPLPSVTPLSTGTAVATGTRLPPSETPTRTPSPTRTVPANTATREVPSTAYRIRVTYVRADSYRDEIAGARISTAHCGVKDRYSAPGYVDGNKTLLVWLSDGQSCRIDRITGEAPRRGLAARAVSGAFFPRSQDLQASACHITREGISRSRRATVCGCARALDTGVGQRFPTGAAPPGQAVPAGRRASPGSPGPRRARRKRPGQDRP